jgi:hypothetical protein
MKRLILVTLALGALIPTAALGAGELVYPKVTTLACPTQNALNQMIHIVKDAMREPTDRGQDQNRFTTKEWDFAFRSVKLNCVTIEPTDGMFEIQRSNGGYCAIKEQYADVRTPSKWVLCAAIQQE